MKALRFLSKYFSFTFRSFRPFSTIIQYFLTSYFPTATSFHQAPAAMYYIYNSLSAVIVIPGKKVKTFFSQR